MHNLGDGSLVAGSVHATDSLKAMAIGDVTGDGWPDAVVAAYAASRIDVLPNLLSGFPSLGYQHAASFGTPHLATTGAPVPDAQVSFAVTGVPAPALGFLILGLDFTPQPFVGGTLVPSPDALLPMRSGVALSGRWPELTVGTKVYMQAWFASGGEVTATNAVMAVSQ